MQQFANSVHNHLQNSGRACCSKHVENLISSRGIRTKSLALSNLSGFCPGQEQRVQVYQECDSPEQIQAQSLTVVAGGRVIPTY